MYIRFAGNATCFACVAWVGMPVIGILVDFTPVQFSGMAPRVKDEAIFEALLRGDNGNTAVLAESAIIADRPGEAKLFQI